ncbi:MAG: hypothetical protein FWH28_05415 [Clostridiales bacterium]|nr:hypothetical protein [Clostridiales bacterium]
MIDYLSDVHRKFLLDEFGVNINSLEDLDSLDDEVFVNIHNKLCLIEEEEFAYSNESERGDIAIDIQDYMAQQMEFEDMPEELDEHS